MKQSLLVVLLSLIGIYLFGGSLPPEDASARFLIADRIRNTIAVDSDVAGEGVRFYATTFGLKNYSNAIGDNDSYRAPAPQAASLVKFGVKNSIDLWRFTGTQIFSFDDPIFSGPGLAPMNCYNVTDQALLSSAEGYPTLLQCTDNQDRTEGLIRYESGTGSWASPVLYKDAQGDKHLLILNKSGCLMSLMFTASSIVMDWSLDLRSAERTQYSDSFKFEFMATPVVLGSKIYIAGLKSIHVVDLESSLPLLSSYPCLSVGEDYFEMPLAFDTIQGNQRSFYAISRLGEIFELTGSQINTISDSP